MLWCCRNTCTNSAVSPEVLLASGSRGEVSLQRDGHASGIDYGLRQLHGPADSVARRILFFRQPGKSRTRVCRVWRTPSAVVGIMAFRHMIPAPSPVGFGTCGQILPVDLDLTSPSNPCGTERNGAYCLGDRADFTKRCPAQLLDPFNGRHGRTRFGKEKS